MRAAHGSPPRLDGRNPAVNTVSNTIYNEVQAGNNPEIWAHMEGHGIVTCSSGNFAQGMARATLELGLDYTVIVPHHIARFKLARIRQYNPAARVIRVAVNQWRRLMIEASG